jgi:hypothetical protein
MQDIARLAAQCRRFCAGGQCTAAAVTALHAGQSSEHLPGQSCGRVRLPSQIKRRRQCLAAIRRPEAVARRRGGGPKQQPQAAAAKYRRRFPAPHRLSGPITRRRPHAGKQGRNKYQTCQQRAAQTDEQKFSHACSPRMSRQRQRSECRAGGQGREQDGTCRCTAQRMLLPGTPVHHEIDIE